MNQRHFMMKSLIGDGLLYTLIVIAIIDKLFVYIIMQRIWQERTKLIFALF